MTRIEYAPSTRGDFERIVKHLIAVRHPDPALRIAEIVHAIEVQHATPMIGRPSSGSLRELIVGRGAHGYVAHYRYVRAQDIAYVLSVRSQREAGYRTKRSP